MSPMPALSDAQLAAARKFVCRWLQAVVPDIQSVKQCPDGRLLARDALGWRPVGTMADFVVVARALGRLPC